MGRDKALYARGKRGDLVCAMQTWSPRLWSTNWRASTFVLTNWAASLCRDVPEGQKIQYSKTRRYGKIEDPFSVKPVTSKNMIK